MSGVKKSKNLRCPECKRCLYWESELDIKVCYICERDLEVVK